MQTASYHQTHTKSQTSAVSTAHTSHGGLVLTSIASDNKPLRGDALAKEKKTQAEKVAHHEENLQYGESISEHGYGGQTTSGQKEQEPQNLHYGRDPKDEEKTELDQRKKQGYGEGSGVGA